ncbi:MAG: LUD domain-containing protein [Firmicutes bacterium]|nr:LUD domain-containing protein [Bacillota bacterium]MCM1402070.1 LUD domain-containing protein [Bacteroides sp.]MCM1478004.1 LUD domain-containing protein [Bacteroides sp.]
MLSRTKILSRIKAGHPNHYPLPRVPMFPFQGEPREQFENMLKQFDGELIEFPSRPQVIVWLEENIDMEHRRVFSSIDDFSGNFSLNPSSDLHRAAQVDVCVADGLMGVGETGSVWVTDKSLGVPAAALLSTDLFLLLDKKTIVGSLHEAYGKINLGNCCYGSFYTGPSATADIEAVRVTGAQGEISLTVLLY